MALSFSAVSAPITSWFTMFITNSKTPSLSFSTTLPMNPSVTTTSAAPRWMSRPSMLPTNRSFSGLVAEQVVRLLHEVVPLALLLADVHQADGRPFDAEHVPGEDGAHDAVLEQVLGLGEDVGPDVDDDAAALRGGHDGGDAGPVDALEELPRLAVRRRPPRRCCRR